ncbi:MAG: heparinase II/III family protein [Opitutaceae bacterium]
MTSVPSLGLLFDSAEVPRIRTTLQRPEFAAFWDGARRADLAADERFLREELRLNNPNSDLARAANILQRCAFVQAIESDPAQVALARLALDRMLAYKRWDWILEAGRDTVGVMRNGTTSVGAVLAADWLGSGLPAVAHDALIRHLVDEAGPAAERAVFGMTHHDQVVGWTMDPGTVGIPRVDVSRWPQILDVNNLRVIATSGLAAVAAFLAGRHPRAPHWAAMARDSLLLFASRLPADGTFPEGPDYWHFTFTYFIVSVELLRRRCGIDLRDCCDFPAMTRYVQAVAAPTRDNPVGCLNIGDAFRSSGSEPLAWIGRHYRDATANHLVLSPGAVRSETVSTAWSAIWFEPCVPARRSADLKLDQVLYPGIVVSRSGWTAADSVLSLRSGLPENHEHADRNSLIFTAHGERLLHDPLKAAYWRADPRWMLRLTAAHTALLIDGRGHQYHEGEEGTNASQATARLTDHRIGPDWMLAVSDATDAYARGGLPATLVRRTVVFLKPDVLIVCDEVRLTSALNVQTRWQVFNDDGRGSVTAETSGFIIARPHASLRAIAAGMGALTITAGHHPLPVEGGVYPFASITSAPAVSHCLVTVCMAAPSDGDHGNLTTVRNGDSWQVAGTHRNRSVRVSLTPQAEGPPIVVL